MDDVNNMLANWMVTVRVARDRALAKQKEALAAMETEQGIVHIDENRALAEKARAYAASYEKHRIVALEGELLEEHSPDAPVKSLKDWPELRAACERAGRLRPGERTALG